MSVLGFGRHVDAAVTSLSWTRTVQMEQQQWVAKRGSWAPGGDDVRNVQKHHESRWVTATDYQQGPAGPDGFSTPQPVTRQELQTFVVYSYEQLGWRKGRALNSSGTTQEEVYWPEYALAPGERVRSTKESCTATFTRPADPSNHKGAKDYSADLDQAEWATLSVGRTYRLTLGVLGGVHKFEPLSS